jgi:hypothetical protein
MKLPLQIISRSEMATLLLGSLSVPPRLRRAVPRYYDTGRFFDFAPAEKS